MTLYGLKSCDTCRAARKWLDDAGLEHRYHDVRKDGLDVDIIRSWTALTDWQSLINKRSRTWRSIPEADRSGLDELRAISLLVEYPTLVKRPVLIGDGEIRVGFSYKAYESLR